MSIYYQFINVTVADILINDMGKNFPAGVGVILESLGFDKISESTDLIKAVCDDQIILKDTYADTTFDKATTIRMISTGGGRSPVNRDGILRVHASPRPLGLWTHFAGAGDLYVPATENNPEGWIVGAGPSITFRMTSKDVSKSIDLRFSEDIHMKDGFVIVEDAPFGASLSMDVIHPLYGPVNSFARRVPFLRSGWFDLNSEDTGHVPFGLTVRITVTNADGGPNGDPNHDAPSNFRASGRIEMYRATTVTSPTVISQLQPNT